MLLAKILGLTQDEITEIKQALAGEINKGKDALYKDTLQEQQTKIMQQNEQLQNVIKKDVYKLIYYVYIFLNINLIIKEWFLL